MLHQKKGRIRYVAIEELYGDKILTSALGSSNAIENNINAVVRAGILLRVKRQNSSDALMLNLEENHQLVSSIGSIDKDTGLFTDPWEIENNPPEIYSLYEQNIGILTPIISERLTEAEDKYPTKWIIEAVGIAVEQNHRSWAYILRILERWDTEGSCLLCPIFPIYVICMPNFYGFVLRRFQQLLLSILLDIYLQLPLIFR